MTQPGAPTTVPDALATAVRRVLPAVNLQPSGFVLEPGFAERAARRRGPTTVALDGMRRLLVVLRDPAPDSPDEVAAHDARQAFNAQPERTREQCQGAVVAWWDGAGAAHAAAFAVAADASLGGLVGMSWRAPETWPRPMIDPGVSGVEGLDRALGSLAAAIADRHTPGFRAAFDRAVTLVDLELQYHGGEGQSVATRPEADADDQTWARWLADYERATRDEWRRIADTPMLTGSGALPPIADGPMAGITVFLSYARPDAVALALPVHAALRGCGATVWFDREQALDAARLDAGLAGAIAGCDAYVLCASDEFFERGGYATQEVAWALAQSARGRAMRLAVVARPGAVLPSVVARWPRIELASRSPADLGEALARALSAPTDVGPPPSHAAPRRARPQLPPQVDLAAMRQRARHVRRFDELPTEDFVAMLEAGAKDRRAVEARALLRRCGDGLGWSGSLRDQAGWPTDPLVRDLRWRLGAMRAVAGVYLLPAGDDGADDDVAAEVAVLVHEPVPLLGWPAVPGWGENERRLALRHHAGLLRILQQMLERGLYPGLLDVPSATIDTWAREVVQRRRECHDGLVALRLDGALSWHGEPVTWDALYRAWVKLLRYGDADWKTAVTAEVRLALVGGADDVAAGAAEVGWCAAHYGGFFAQGLDLRTIAGPVTALVCAACPSEELPSTAQLRLGLVADRGGPATIELAWSGAILGEGRHTCPAPAALAQSLSLSSS